LCVQITSKVVGLFAFVSPVRKHTHMHLHTGHSDTHATHRQADVFTFQGPQVCSGHCRAFGANAADDQIFVKIAATNQRSQLTPQTV